MTILKLALSLVLAVCVSGCAPEPTGADDNSSTAAQTAGSCLYVPESGVCDVYGRVLTWCHEGSVFYVDCTIDSGFRCETATDGTASCVQ